MKTSKTVDQAIRDTYAALAHAAGRRALTKVQNFDCDEAEPFMEMLEVWLRRAGARATDRYFSVPR